jgi:crossover junction endodeoxyribonuclease RuvC
MIGTEPYRVVGIDPSLTALGLAVTSGPDLAPLLYCIKPKLRGHERLALLLTEVARHAEGADLAVIEGLAYGAQGSALLDLAGLHWLIRQELWRLGIPYAVVAPPQAKQFATGKGSADKHDMVRAVYQRWPQAESWGRVGPDEADALWLAAMGAQWLGQPVVALPLGQADVVHAKWDGKVKGHKRGDPKIRWPAMDGSAAAARPEAVVEALIVGDVEGWQPTGLRPGPPPDVVVGPRGARVSGHHVANCPGGACRCGTVPADGMTGLLF